jgi:hypothetical protein
MIQQPKVDWDTTPKTSHELVTASSMRLILRYMFLTCGGVRQQEWAYIRSSLNKLWGIMCMNSPKVRAHEKCKAYQKGWLELSIAFKVGQNFISTKYK